MSLSTCGLTILLCGAIGVILLLILYILFRYILPEYKHASKEMTIDELYEVINSIIAAECAVMERDYFVNIKALTNQSYENYYQHLSRQCLNALSETFIYRASHIMNEDSIADYVCRVIGVYLQSKLADGLPKNPSSDI